MANIIDNKDKNELTNKCLKFIEHNQKVVISSLAVLVLLIILGSVAGKNNKEIVVDTEVVEVATETESQDTESETEVAVEESTEYKIDEVPEISELINNYYTAYASGDTDTLSTLATPLSDMEKSYIGVFSQYVEEYQNVVCYTKNGMDADTYIVSASLSIKFNDIATPAPGLDFFYVRTDSDGKLYIDNVYSQFNLANQEEELDSNVVDFINDFEQQSDVKELQAKVQENYELCIQADSDLNTMVTSTLPAAISNWAADKAEEAKKAEEDAEAAKAAEEAAAEEAAKAEEAKQKLAEKYANAITAVTTEKINVRSSASTDAEVIGQLGAGSQTTVLELRDDGWAEIDYNAGQLGYVMQKYLTAVNADTTAETATTDESQTGTADSTGIAAGTVITIKSSTNIRESMDTNSTKVATVFSGEKVTVVESYAEGWTKVSYNNITGYIKTDLLQ